MIREIYFFTLFYLVLELKIVLFTGVHQLHHFRFLLDVGWQFIPRSFLTDAQTIIFLKIAALYG